jgi:ATP phosphoribosyltransferase regulatory subunit
VIELGHVGIFRCLAAAAGMSQGLEDAVFGALQRKAQPDLVELFADADVASRIAAIVTALPNLLGGRSVLARARSEFAGAPAAVLTALSELEALADAVTQRCAGVRLRFDLCELTGYGYHTGVVFAAYSANFGRAVARGGRYDGIGAAFGRGRAATGFDVDLKRLPKAEAARRGLIWAPGVEWVDVAQRDALVRAVAELRRAGEAVVGALAPQAQPDAACDRELVWGDDSWRVRPLQRHS